MIFKLMRYMIALVFAVTGYAIISKVMPIITDVLDLRFLGMGILEAAATEIIASIIGSVLFFIIGYIVGPACIRWGVNAAKNLERVLSRLSVKDLLMGTLGLAFGLIIAILISLAFHNIPIVGTYVPLIISPILGYLGIHLMIRKQTDILQLWYSMGRQGGAVVESTVLAPTREERQLEGQQVGQVSIKLLDTSVIIDGRIADLCQTGFLEGTLVAPLFVLGELQKIADSSDTLKRNRGRRGLDVLQRMQKDATINIVLADEDYDDITEVDSKLMRLALEKKWTIMTNDFNLNKVAALQGIQVLNLNDLAKAMKPTRLPGEWMRVQVIKEGKEEGQGVAYLDDGTMIVIENGVLYINETIDVMVTSVLQTSAGKMIFARPEGEKE